MWNPKYKCPENPFTYPYTVKNLLPKWNWGYKSNFPKTTLLCFYFSKVLCLLMHRLISTKSLGEIKTLFDLTCFCFVILFSFQTSPVYHQKHTCWNMRKLCVCFIAWEKNMRMILPVKTVTYITFFQVFAIMGILVKRWR